MASSVRRAVQRLGGGAAAAARGALVAGQPTPATHPELLQPGELLPGIAAAEFAARRSQLAAMLPQGAMAVLPAAPLTYMAGAWRGGAGLLHAPALLLGRPSARPSCLLLSTPVPPVHAHMLPPLPTPVQA